MQLTGLRRSLRTRKARLPDTITTTLRNRRSFADVRRRNSDQRLLGLCGEVDPETMLLRLLSLFEKRHEYNQERCGEGGQALVRSERRFRSKRIRADASPEDHGRRLMSASRDIIRRRCWPLCWLPRHTFLRRSVTRLLILARPRVRLHRRRS